MSLRSLFVEAAPKFAPRPPATPPSEAHYAGCDASHYGFTAGETPEERAYKRRKAEEVAAGLTAERSDRFAECIVLQLDHDMIADIYDADSKYTSHDLDHINALKTLVGRWWMVKRIEGAPVFRQEAPSDDEQISNKSLWLWRNDKHTNRSLRGWYITEELGNDNWEWDNVHGFGANVPGEPMTFPSELHVPYWKWDVEPCLSVTSYTAWLEDRYEAMKTSRDDYFSKVCTLVATQRTGEIDDIAAAVDECAADDEIAKQI